MAKRTDTTVRIDAGVLADARIAAAYKEMSIAEYVSESLKPVIARDIEDGHARRKQGTTAPATKGKTSKKMG